MSDRHTFSIFFLFPAKALLALPLAIPQTLPRHHVTAAATVYYFNTRRAVTFKLILTRRCRHSFRTPSTNIVHCVLSNEFLHHSKLIRRVFHVTNFMSLVVYRMMILSITKYIFLVTSHKCDLIRTLQFSRTVNMYIPTNYWDGWDAKNIQRMLTKPRFACCRA
jgi:hypothetical protein